MISKAQNKPHFGNRFYNISSEIEKNQMLNRGMLDVFGEIIPWTIMANNKEEAKERFIRASLVFVIAFIVPFAIIPFLNRFFTRFGGIAKKFRSKENKIIQLSNKFLSKSVSKEEMIALKASNETEAIRNRIKEGIKDLETHFRLKFAERLERAEKANKPQKVEKLKKGFEEIQEGLNEVKKEFNGREEILGEKLIRAKNLILATDMLVTGLMWGNTSWIRNVITQITTGRKGFAAEYAMADKEIVEKRAEFHEKTKRMKYMTLLGLTFSAGLIPAILIAKSLLAKNPGKMLKFIKDSAHKFDYTEGVFMRRWPLFLLAALTSAPGTILASRNMSEVKDSAIRFASADFLFFAGDQFLNNVFGRMIHKSTKGEINLIKNMKAKSFIQKWFGPIFTMEELTKKKEELLSKGNPAEVKALDRTRKYALRMYWANFIAIVIVYGFGLPYTLNKMIKSDVEKDVKKSKSSNSNSANQYLSRVSPEIMQRKQQLFAQFIPTTSR